MKFKKPLSIFGVLENTIMPSTVLYDQQEIVRIMVELDKKYDMDSFESLDELENAMSKSDFEMAKKVVDHQNSREVQLNKFNTEYKNSLRSLFKEHGLPIHINAFDIHRMNIDIENISNLLKKHENNEDFRTMEFFTDDSIPVFSTAPYPLTFIQLENLDTYRSGIGRVIEKSNQENSKQIKDVMKHTDMTEEEIQAGIRQDCQTYMIVQSYQLNDYIGHLHMYNGKHNKGVYVGDTLRTAFNMDEQIERVMEQLVEDGKFNNKEEVEMSMQWVQIYDIIQIFDDELFLEEQVVTFLDKHGKPTFAKSTFSTKDDDVDVSSNSQYYLTSCEKVFQWWNSDNDILDETNLEIKPSWKKRQKLYTRKNKHKGTNLIYKTLTVKPSIKVVGDSGEERSPRLEEIVAHMRRGHWAHYGVNGKGLLFGKYAKSVYRKPSVVGKLANGLVIKDYTLENN